MTMIRMVLITTSFSLYVLLSSCEDPISPRSIQTAIKSQQEKHLIEALQAVLEKLKNKDSPNTTKKFGQLPSCDAGEQCAARKGARVGKLCGCPSGTSCDLFIMKCL
ncbi:cocaine- and amphetamine-regulated transcript protein-like [Trichomycterus rosablanca]|uniref:cocaine- and amphetamine-regulated transcript protein-like n=1 Tax=Trichomycterus rosablanca TaxID=2290929 RepID=UPI002F35F5F6